MQSFSDTELVIINRPMPNRIFLAARLLRLSPRYRSSSVRDCLFLSLIFPGTASGQIPAPAVPQSVGLKIQDIFHPSEDRNRNKLELSSRLTFSENVCSTASVLLLPFPNNTSTRTFSVLVPAHIKINVGQAEALLHSMANHFGGDPAATDAARVLRLPGFANRKLAFEFVVQVVQASDQVHSLRDFNVREGFPEAPRRASTAFGSLRPPGRRSQSELDWAYAKRALARGDDPEVVVQRIADYRADDKPNPEYYARPTVKKAQAGRIRR